MIPKTAFIRKSENIAGTASNDLYSNFNDDISQFYIYYLCYYEMSKDANGKWRFMIQPKLTFLPLMLLLVRNETSLKGYDLW